MAGLSDILETTQLEKVAEGFVFTEGPLWHPDGFWYFVDIRQNLLYRMMIGQKPEVVRKTIGGNGTTFDLQGRLIQCEGDGRMVTRLAADGSVTTLADRFEGKKLNRPNDVICHSDGSLFFTDPGYRVPLAERELDAAVYRIAPDGAVSLAVPVEYPNGLALSPDERTLYIANTRWCQYIHAVELDCGRQHGAPARVRRHVGGRHQRRAGRHEGGPGRACLLHRHRRGLGVRTRRFEDRHHRDAGGVRQLRVRRPGPAHPVPDRQHVRLYAAGEDAGHAASLLQARLTYPPTELPLPHARGGLGEGGPDYALLTFQNTGAGPFNGSLTAFLHAARGM